MFAKRKEIIGIQFNAEGIGEARSFVIARIRSGILPCGKYKVRKIADGKFIAERKISVRNTGAMIICGNEITLIKA